MTHFDGIGEAIKAYGFRDFSAAADRLNSQVEIQGLGTVTLVDSKTGAEGEGENIWIIFSIEGDAGLYRISGYYDSYEGEEWSGRSIEKVVPRTKTITVYDSVQ